VSAPSRPGTVAELGGIVRDAAAAKRPFEVRGGGSKARLGRATQTAATLDVTGLAGITLHEPAELVIAARAGTPLAEVEAVLASKGQMLPFEPMDHRVLLGSTAEPTIGGIVAAGVSGPRRVAVGACRDALIGAKFVNGRGEEIVSGGRVMKNVTGYDLLKVQAGAYGTLGVLTEVTFKVLPLPLGTATLVVEGQPFEEAVATLSAALGSPFEVTGAAWMPGDATHPARTLMRLEIEEASIVYRGERLADDLGVSARRAGAEESAALWRDVRDVTRLSTDPSTTVWRVSVAPTKAPAVVAAARGAGLVDMLADWGGGLLWLAMPGSLPDGGQAAIRAATKAAGGHATLIRASEPVRASVAPFEPQADGLMRLTKGLKGVFDPAGVFNPGRMYAGV
jgi:glycolate oxidase FAD binding subunit